MTWTSRVLVLVAVLGFLSPVAARAAESPTKEQARQAAEVRKKLAATIDFPGTDQGTKLEEALDLLTKLSGVKFEVNTEAFRAENIVNVAQNELYRELRKANQISVEKVLRRILDRVADIGPTHPTFTVRGGVVEISTRYFASPANWHRPESPALDEGGGSRGAQAPEVSIAFDKRELQDALQEIADAAGVNIVLDARAGEKGKAAVTATVNNAAVDTVVRLLADMADLQAVMVDEIIYVTTKENAKALREEKARMMKAEEPEPAKPSPAAQ
jgi:hypothetical protein